MKMRPTKTNNHNKPYKDEYNVSDKVRNKRCKHTDELYFIAYEIAAYIEDIVTFMPKPRQYCGKLLHKQQQLIDYTKDDHMTQMLEAYNCAYEKTINKYDMKDKYKLTKMVTKK